MFENGYRGGHPQRRLARRGGITTLEARLSAIVACMALLTIASGLLVLVGTHSPSPMRPNAFLPAGQPTSSYDNGRVSVTVPSALPSILLTQDLNGPIFASLQLTGIYELGHSSTGTLVTDAQADMNFMAVIGHGTSVDNGDWWFNLTFQAPVVAVENPPPLGPHPADQHTPGELGATTVRVNYTLADPTPDSSGVSLTWTVLSWPYVNVTDILALQFGFADSFGGGLTACTASSMPTLGATACPGNPIGTGAPSWSASTNGVEGQGPMGPIALLTWTPSMTIPGGQTAAITPGADLSPTGAADLLLGAPTGGGVFAGGALTFAIVTPTLPAALLPAVSNLIHGDGIAYLSALAVGSVGVITGVAGYRTYDRRVRSEL